MRSPNVSLLCRVISVVVLFSIPPTQISGAEEKQAAKPPKKAVAESAKEPASFSKGSEALRAGKLDEAIAAFEQAVKDNPAHAASAQFLARAYYDKKRYGESVKLGKRATEMEPKNARAWRTLGLAQLGTNDPKAAADSFAQSAEIEPRNFWTQNNLGYALLLAERHDDARKALERAVELDAKNAMTWNTLGVARLRAGDRPAAAEAFKKALAIDPNYAKAKDNLSAAEAKGAAPKEQK